MTRFLFTPEQQELRQTLRGFLADRAALPRLRELIDTEPGYDPAVWNQLSGQLGVAGLAIPAEFGGAGGGPVDQIIAAEEMGRALYSGPYLGSAVLAATALLAAADSRAAAELLPGIAAGTTVATLAVPEDDGDWGVTGLATRAAPAPGGYRLTGRKSYVLDGLAADLILVVAASEGGPSLFAVTAGAAGLTRRTMRGIDLARRLATIGFDQVPARLIGTEGAAAAAVDRAVLLAAVVLAAEQVGGAQRCLDMSVEYARLRVQFGRPVGSFQAIKHLCADTLLEVESARSAAYYAAWAAADEAADLPLAACLAKSYCSEVYQRAAAASIQIHGGIGFTWEHDAHLYYRRAVSSRLLLASPEHYRERAASYLIDGAGPAVG